jgi:hypothetical protein
MMVEGKFYPDGYRKYLDPPDLIQMIPSWGVLSIASECWTVAYRNRQEAPGRRRRELSEAKPTNGA